MGNNVWHGITFDKGLLFRFETVNGVRGAGIVREVSTEAWRSHAPVFCQWWDHLGKHYEWMNPAGFVQFAELKHITVNDGRLVGVVHSIKGDQDA